MDGAGLRVRSKNFVFRAYSCRLTARSIVVGLRAAPNPGAPRSLHGAEMSNPAVDPIPAGMHSLTPHLCCAGAADAIEFYKRAFDAVELGRMPGLDGKLMHAMVKIGDSMLMLVDENASCGMLGPRMIKGSPVDRPVRRRRRRDREESHGSRGQGDDARRRDVLGRPLRPSGRPVRVSMVGRNARARRHAGRDEGGMSAMPKPMA